MFIHKLMQSIAIASLICLGLIGFDANAWIVSPDYKPKKTEPVLLEDKPGSSHENSQSAVVTFDTSMSVTEPELQLSPSTAKTNEKAKTESSPQPQVTELQGRNSKVKAAQAKQSPAKSLTVKGGGTANGRAKVTVQPVKTNPQVNDNRTIFTRQQTGGGAKQVEHTIPQRTNRGPAVIPEEQKVQRAKHEQDKLDQGLIEAQIDNVLGSAEFLELERAVEKAQPKRKVTTKDPLTGEPLPSEPEDLLNQLDESDLMDYVAEDDLWKEQLTIEDEP